MTASTEAAKKAKEDEQRLSEDDIIDQELEAFRKQLGDREISGDEAD